MGPKNDGDGDNKFEVMLASIIERPNRYAEMQLNMHMQFANSNVDVLEVASARAMIEILFVRGQKTYSMRAMLDACALRAPSCTGNVE